MGCLPKRERKRRERIDESKNVQTTPTRTYCKCSRPLSYCYPNCRTPLHWKFTQHLRTTRPPPLEKEAAFSCQENDGEKKLIFTLCKQFYNLVIIQGILKELSLHERILFHFRKTSRIRMLLARRLPIQSRCNDGTEAILMSTHNIPFSL